MHSSVIALKFVCLILFNDIALTAETKLPGSFGYIQQQNASFYLAPEIGNRIVQLDSNYDLVTEYVLSGLPFFAIKGFSAGPFSFFLSDGDSIYQYYGNFARFQTLYRSRGVLDFVVTPEGEVIAVDNYGSRLVYLDRFGEPKNSLTRYRVRAIARHRRNIWIAEKSRIVRLDEFGNEVESVTLKGVLRLAADSNIVAALVDKGKKVTIVKDRKQASYDLQEKARAILLRSRRIFCLGEKGNVLFEYSFDP